MWSADLDRLAGCQGPSEAMRASMDYFAHSPGTRTILERLAALDPSTLACMHGSAWRGDGRRLILDLADTLHSRPVAAEVVGA